MSSNNRFIVRNQVLLIRKFTLPEMVHATGLTDVQVTAELDTLVQEHTVFFAAGHYRLIADPEEVLKLSKSVQAAFDAW